MPDTKTTDPAVRPLHVLRSQIRDEVVAMHFRRHIWRELNEMLERAPDQASRPSLFWNFHHGNYGATQSMAVRRQLDTDKRTASLYRLVVAISQVKSLDHVEEARADLKTLKRETGNFHKWAHENVAHTALTPISTFSPRYDDIHKMIDFLSGMFQKYEVLLTGATTQFDGLAFGGGEHWQAIFRVPWLTAGSANTRIESPAS